MILNEKRFPIYLRLYQLSFSSLSSWHSRFPHDFLLYIHQSHSCTKNTKMSAPGARVSVITLRTPKNVYLKSNINYNLELKLIFDSTALL